MLIDGQWRQYVDVIILSAACTCVGHHDGRTRKPPKLRDKHGGEVPPRSGWLAGIVQFTVPVHAKQGDGQLEASWRGMQNHPKWEVPARLYPGDTAHGGFQRSLTVSA